MFFLQMSFAEFSTNINAKYRNLGQAKYLCMFCIKTEVLTFPLRKKYILNNIFLAFQCKHL